MNRAKLSVTAGPDRGRSFDLEDELVHIGKGAGNQIVLSDDTLAEHQASIVRRNGRFAIYTTATEGIEIEGNPVPAERWVWLPSEASIRISRKTLCQFIAPDGDSEERLPEFSRADSARTEPTQTAPTRPEVVRNEPVKQAESQKAKRASLRPAPLPAAPLAAPSTAPLAGTASFSASSDSAAELPEHSSDAPKQKRIRKNMARFITDGPGDPLVKLGADGHLPELRLDAGNVRAAREPSAKQANPLIFLAAIGVSFMFSILMLFMDMGTSSERTSKSSARVKIEKYYGEKDERLEPYQLALRRARQAYSRKNLAEERAEYRSVLNQLRAEGRKKSLSGLTGNKRDRTDDELEGLISILLSD